MKRRLNIGIGLLHEPSLLVLDEPTVGVDPQSRDAILASVEQLGATGIGVLYTTHYMEEAERLCDRVGIVDHGKMVAEGTRRELVALVGEHDHVRLGLEADRTRRPSACWHLPEVLSVGRRTTASTSACPTLTDALPVDPVDCRGGRGPGAVGRGGRAGPGGRVPAPHRPGPAQLRLSQRPTMPASADDRPSQCEARSGEERHAVEQRARRARGRSGQARRLAGSPR